MTKKKGITIDTTKIPPLKYASDYREIFVDGAYGVAIAEQGGAATIKFGLYTDNLGLNDKSKSELQRTVKVNIIATIPSVKIIAQWLLDTINQYEEETKKQ